MRPDRISRIAAPEAARRNQASRVESVDRIAGNGTLLKIARNVQSALIYFRPAACILESLELASVAVLRSIRPARLPQLSASKGHNISTETFEWRARTINATSSLPAS
jgi:hypothetical protein